MGNALWEKYQTAVRQYDLCTQADCFMEAFQRTASHDMQSFFAGKSDILFVTILQALQNHNGQQALQCFSFFSQELFRVHPLFYFLRGKTFYVLARYQAAEADFLQYMEYCPEDEAVYFYLGNLYAMTKRIDKALSFYEMALSCRKFFPEVMVNISCLMAALGDDETRRQLSQNPRFAAYLAWGDFLQYEVDDLSSNVFSDEEIKAFPIFINSCDRLGCLQKLVDWLLSAGYTQLYILDNASTYQPLLNYYRLLEERGVKVLYLRQNMGYKALWKSNILEILQVVTPYVYTDSDVVPGKRCPDDLVRHLLKVLQTYPYLKKAGCALAYEDITFYGAEEIRKKEAGFYDIALEKEVYFAAVDTTFALYRNYHHYSLYEAARVGGRITARHLPWYYDYEQLPEDEAYYLAHADQSSSLARELRLREDSR